MRLAFDVQHDDVKNDREDRDDRDDERDHLEQRADVPARLSLAQEVGELRNEQLHARSPLPRVGVPSRRNAGCTGKRPVGGPIGSRAGRRLLRCRSQFQVDDDVHVLADRHPACVQDRVVGQPEVGTVDGRGDAAAHASDAAWVGDGTR